jgi:hypothetical protein
VVALDPVMVILDLAAAALDPATTVLGSAEDPVSRARVGLPRVPLLERSSPSLRETTAAWRMSLGLGVLLEDGLFCMLGFISLVIKWVIYL